MNFLTNYELFMNMFTSLGPCFGNFPKLPTTQWISSMHHLEQGIFSPLCQPDIYSTLMTSFKAGSPFYENIRGHQCCDITKMSHFFIRNYFQERVLVRFLKCCFYHVNQTLMNSRQRFLQSEYFLMGLEKVVEKKI